MNPMSRRGTRRRTPQDKESLERERFEILERLKHWLETPMLILAFVWLALLIVELIWVRVRCSRPWARASMLYSSSILRLS